MSRRRWGPGDVTPALRALLRQWGVPDAASPFSDATIAQLLGISRQHVRRLRTGPDPVWRFHAFEHLRLIDPAELFAGWQAYRLRVTLQNLRRSRSRATTRSEKAGNPRGEPRDESDTGVR